jgi:divalent metal cation (Fe/Co/Zn/Cd) transporter
MSTNRHRQKYLLSLLAGLGLVSGGILIVLYTSRLDKGEERTEWMIWAVAALSLINSGLYLLGNAFVHKVKSDLIRKQKQREQHKKYEFE